METEIQTQTKVKGPDVYTIISDQIIRQLEEGIVPWKKNWALAGLPKNLVSQKAYRGINVWLLSSLGYEKNFFLTFKQVKEIGAKVKKDEKGHLVAYWDWVEKEIQSSEKHTNGNGYGDQKKVPHLRYYKVFNIAQIDGIPEDFIVPEVSRVENPTAACESLIEGISNVPKLFHKKKQACYNPLEDFIIMPPMESFERVEQYYSTFFHELAHSTGHYGRLNRSTLIQMTEFGWSPFTHEELVAEIATCYMESVTGINTAPFKPDSDYVTGWYNKLKSDKRFIFSATAHAQKATDFILNLRSDEKKEEEMQF